MTVVPWLPPLLPGIERGDALWNAVVSYSGHPIPLANGANAVFALAEPPDGDALGTALQTANGVELHVQWQAFPFNAMFSADFTVNDLSAVPTALRAALIEGMTSLVWNAIPERRLGDFRIVRIGPLRQLLDEDRRTQLGWFQVTVQNLAKEPVVFLVGCERAALLELLSGRLLAPQQVHKSLKSQLTTDAFFTLAAVPITIKALKALEPGAVVVLPEQDAAALDLRAGDAVYHFKLNENRWTCLGVRRRDAGEGRAVSGNGAETMAADASERPVEPVQLSSLQIMIDFDLGRTTVTLADLESWKAGSVVALDPPARADGAEVTLRANGQVIGTGDLVRIDDRLGVRISRLYITT